MTTIVAKKTQLTPIKIAGHSVQPGERKYLEIPVGRLPTQTPLAIPVEVVNGVNPGPRLWLSAAIHGDEVNGVEIVRELLERITPESICGAVIAVPIVNVFGFLNESRYLPDRRDLNRSFPGNKKGSLAARLANLFMEEIVKRCTHGIDLHTGAEGRTNFPHIRANLDDIETRRCAEAFQAPLVMSAGAPTGSLRQAAAKRGIPILVYEAGEARRFDGDAVKAGLEGVLRVMNALEMHHYNGHELPYQCLESASTQWLRAKRAGILRLNYKSGDFIKKRQLLGTIGDAFEREVTNVYAPHDGLIISHVTHPLVHQGDAIIHLAQIKT